jgi:hypothetical protein
MKGLSQYSGILAGSGTAEKALGWSAGNEQPSRAASLCMGMTATVVLHIIAVYQDSVISTS